MSGTTPRRRVAPALAAAVLAIGPCAAGAQLLASTGAMGMDPTCVGAVRAWAEGGVAVPLVGFGSRPGAGEHGAVAEGAAPPWDGWLPSGDGIAIGADAAVERGPTRAGASRGDEVQGYSYPGPDTAERSAARIRIVAEHTRGPWVGVIDAAVGSGAPRWGVAALGRVGARAAVVAGVLPTRSGPGCEGGLVLSGGGAGLRGVELGLRRVARWPLAGEVALGLQLGTLPQAGPGNAHPLFHAFRIELRPTPDVTIGLDRAVLFGGSATDVPVTPRTVGLMLLGVTDTRGKDSDFENQVASVDVRLRTRFAGRPTTVSAAWATDDAGWAFVRVPGVRVTAETRRGPHPRGWTGFALTWLAGPTATYPPWYRHGALAWGWTDRGDPLGSGLGGHGLSALATWGVTTPGLAVDARVGLVHRGGENLFAPDLAGTGTQGAIDVVRWSGPWALSLSARVDAAGATAVRTRVSVLRRF